MALARVFVSLKKSVFDPQGKTIHEALQSMGFSGAADVRQGKFFEVSFPGASPQEAQAQAEDMAKRVLSNPVIESFRVEVEP